MPPISKRDEPSFVDDPPRYATGGTGSMKKTHISHNMRESRNTESRKEQWYLYRLFCKSMAPDAVRMEYPVYFGGKKIAQLDIANVTKKTGYRINGMSHSPGNLKDELQAERLLEAGWIIWDVNWWENEWLWKK